MEALPSKSTPPRGCCCCCCCCSSAVNRDDVRVLRRWMPRGTAAPCDLGSRGDASGFLSASRRVASIGRPQGVVDRGSPHLTGLGVDEPDVCAETLRHRRWMTETLRGMIQSPSSTLGSGTLHSRVHGRSVESRVVNRSPSLPLSICLSVCPASARCVSDRLYSLCYFISALVYTFDIFQ